MYLLSNWTDGLANSCVIALVELIIENSLFYPLFWLLGKLLPQKETKKEDGESLKELLAVEGLDLVLRFLLFLVAIQLPSIKAWLSGLGSLALDIAFLFALSRSHQLLTIVREIRSAPKLISLRLTEPITA